MKRSNMKRDRDIKTKNHANEVIGSPRKRSKLNTQENDEFNYKNFALAVEEVSGNEYFDYRSRFQLVYLPSCTSLCVHDRNYTTIKQMPTYAEESFKTEIRNHMWYDALEVCRMSITATQYLSADVLQEVVEIMLNVHEDKCSDYSAQYIVNICQQILLQNFTTHPPCQDKDLRNCYVKFLTNSMPLKKNTKSNRSNYEYNKGIVTYCMNRLESELSSDSCDGPLVNMYMPDDLRDTVQGYYWQKQNFEIFESLNREERIKRLFAVLETIIEVLQSDLAIQQSRYLDDNSRHMRCNKLMESVLWSSNDTSAISRSCRQIIRIFANMVHLQYPIHMVKTMAIWLNTMVHTIYTRETHLHSDYPNILKNCLMCAEEFYNIVADLPHDSIIRILEKIEPSYMRHIVGLFYINRILSINEGCILKILEYFVSQSEWKSFETDEVEIYLSGRLFNPPERLNDKIGYLLSKCSLSGSETVSTTMFKKKDPKLLGSTKAGLHHVIKSLYITLDASLDANKLQSVQETYTALNKQILNGSLLCSYSCYSVSDAFVCRYKHNLDSIKQLGSLFNDLRRRRKLPKIFNIFRNIRLLELNF